MSTGTFITPENRYNATPPMPITCATTPPAAECDYKGSGCKKKNNKKKNNKKKRTIRVITAATTKQRHHSQRDNMLSMSRAHTQKRAQLRRKRVTETRPAHAPVGDVIVTKHMTTGVAVCSGGSVVHDTVTIINIASI